MRNAYQALNYLFKSKLVVVALTLISNLDDVSADLGRNAVDYRLVRRN